jgi:hypothetical protein
MGAVMVRFSVGEENAGSIQTKLSRPQLAAALVTGVLLGLCASHRTPEVSLRLRRNSGHEPIIWEILFKIWEE